MHLEAWDQVYLTSICASQENFCPIENILPTKSFEKDLQFREIA